MAKDVLTFIKMNERSFTKTEKKIMNYILKNTDKVIYMTITELSDELKIGEGTIVRFCQKLGFSGFHPFKIALAECFKPQFEYESDLISKCTNANIEIIRKTAEFLDKRSIDQAINIITKTDKLFILGVGASGITAQDAFYKFMRIGINCVYSPDVHLLSMQLSLGTCEDSVLAISQSGSTSSVVDMARMAKDKNMKVIALTGYLKSPLTQFADIVLLTPTRETPFQSGAIRSKIAQLHVIEILFEGLCIKLQEKAEKSIRITADSVSKWIY